MKKSLIFAFFLYTANLFASPLPPSTGSIPSSLMQSRMLAGLTIIEESFAVKYAPTEWKKKNFGWDLKEGISKVRTQVIENPNLPLKEYHILLKEFFHEVKDYHVSISFFSTESATLPFFVKKAEGHYYVVYVDESAECPLETGDQVVTFGGRAIDDVIREIREKEVGKNTPETDQAMAEIILTNRSGHRGHRIPQGAISIGVRKRYSKEVNLYNLTWNYKAEKVTMPPLLDSPLASLARPPAKKEDLGRHPFFNKFFLTAHFDTADLNKKTLNTHAMGAKKSFLPPLGSKLWEVGEESSFDAYIFEMPYGYSIPEGTPIGYIRIPHYVADREEVEEFKEIMLVFRDTVGALVIDQVNNPGGSVFYLYALASLLTDYPLPVPTHCIALTQQEVHMAAGILEALEEVSDEESAVKILGSEIGGYAVDYVLALKLKEFCELLLKEWNKGNYFSQPTRLFGVDTIRPDKDVGFDKPLLILTNSLDFSGGDFFPAIMQDSKRATVLGGRTAGAGGFVVATQFPNRVGIASFNLTGSLAKRVDQQPLENLGVKPDIPYSLSREDLLENYHEYVTCVLQGLEGIYWGR